MLCSFFKATTKQWEAQAKYEVWWHVYPRPFVPALYSYSFLSVMLSTGVTRLWWCSSRGFKYKLKQIIHLNEVCECAVDVGSFRQKETTSWTDFIEEEQLLVLWKNMKRFLFHFLRWHHLLYPCMVSVLPSRCVCGPASSLPPAPSPTPPSLSHLERPHLTVVSNRRTLSGWPGSQRTAGMVQRWKVGRK